MAALMLSAAQKMLKGMTLRLTTDKDGKVKSLDNYDELKVKIDETANNLVEELYKQVPMRGLAEEHAEHDQPDDAER